MDNEITDKNAIISNTYYYQEDHVDLHQLLSSLWAQKLLILLTTIFITLSGITYAFLSVPIYEGNLYLLPSTSKDSLELRKLVKFSKYSSDFSSARIYERFVIVLNSRQAKASFFQRENIKSYYLKINSSEHDAWENFLNDMKISNSTKNDMQQITVSYKNRSQKNSSRWLNDYINHVALITKEQLVADVRAEIDSEKQQTAIQIDSRIELYSSDIKKELAKLNEALAIARALDIVSPINLDAIDNEKSNLMIDEVRRLYKLGSKALEAEISALNSRENNQLFIPGLTTLLQQQAILNSLIIDMNKLQPITIDFAAQSSDDPIAPKKGMIISLSFLFGLIFAFLLAIFRIQYKKFVTQN